MKRSYGRNTHQLRPLSLSYNFFEYAAGSVLLQLGKTKIACAVTLNNKVPSFLRGKKTGWLTAEYAMLPAATKHRTDRESTSFKRNGRSVEISRLIGRSFRSVMDLSLIGERTIVIDCEVLQADGSTRVACITAANFALHVAIDTWLAKGLIEKSPLQEELAAVSVGISGESALLDIDFLEDSSIDADFNFVLTRSGKIIEVQGSAEKNPISWDLLATMRKYATQGIADIFSMVETKGVKEAPVARTPFNQIRLKEQ